MGIEVFRKHLREKRAVKISCSIDIQDFDKFASVCRASQVGRASAIAIPCDKKIYETARKNTKLPVFASSCHPSELLKAAQFGVDAIEIGNYNTLNKTITAQQVYDIVLETMSLTNKYSIYTCVAIPSELDLTQQVGLAQKFELLGVDLIQIENYNHLTNSQAIISNSVNVSRQTILPVICKENYNVKTAEVAFFQGLNGISIKTDMEVNSEVTLSSNIMSVVSSVFHRNSINREISMVK